jgi:hypothetical protein
MKWNDITLKQFYEIQEILSVEDDWTALNLIDCIYNVDCQAMPVRELKKFDIGFLSEPIPEVKLKKHYEINGTKYNSNCDLTKVTVAQFIDYQNYLKEDEVRLEKLLSVFFMPDGCKDYNTGYDIIKVQEDLLDLPIDVAQSIGFFFGRQLRVFFRVFRYYLIKEVKTLKMEKTKKKEIIQNIKKMDLWGLVSYLSSLNTVRLQTKQYQRLCKKV